jgi:AcrR family transcriptional regulator
LCAYYLTVSDLGDRRARKKAQTRQAIRAVAQDLFYTRGFDAVTIADIAQRSDVAVQTVFNHFPTKEELFFDGHTPWVEGPANAVRARKAGEPPLMALRAYLTDEIERLVGGMTCPERRAYIATVSGSVSLRAHERELVHASERLLSDALIEAWSADDCVGAPADPHTAAPITAAVWLSAARVMVVQQRPHMTTVAASDDTVAETRMFADRLLAQMETCLDLIQGAPDMLPERETGWPQPTASQATASRVV